VDRVRPGVARLGRQLVGLDHVLDPRPAGIVGDVQHMDARGAEAGDDQMRSIRTVTRGAAAIPTEVVKLVADVRHGGLVDDRAVLGVHDGDEVGGAHARALVQAGEVQELLGRGFERFLWRGVQGHDLLLRRLN
jgi:hypothetical protein